MSKDFYMIMDQKILDYSEEHTTPENPVLQELNRFTNVNVMNPRMLAGHMLRKLLQFLSKMIQPEKILEIGTYTGYSAICLAEGLKDGGILHTIDINPELEDVIKKYFEKAGFTDKIKLHFGNALSVIPLLEGPFDLVFIDADKNLYPDYYNLVIDKVRSGGYILADNALWDGKVLDPDDKEAEAVARFNDLVHNDERVENLLLPVRDGVMLIWKR